MNRKKYPLIWLVILLIAISLACSTLTGAQQDVSTAKKTISAAETAVGGVVTQVEGMATSIEESGLLQTAVAFATEQGPALLATAEALATQGVSYGEAPADIPIVQTQTIVNFVGSQAGVTYNTTLSLPAVLDFYKREMPAKGWTEKPEDTVEGISTIQLKFEKPDRTATVTLAINPLDQNTIVAILVISH